MRHANRIVFSIWVLAFLLSGCASNRSLKEEIETYEPPSYYRKLAEKKPDDAKSETSGDIETTDVIARLEKKNAEQENEIDILKGKDGTRRIPPVLKDKLAKAAQNQKTASAMLERRISMEELKLLALARNPGVKAAESRLQAERESFTQVENLNEVLRQYSAFTEGLMAGVGPMKGSEPVSMSFPYPGVTALKGQVVEKNVDIARENLEIARRDAAAEVAKTFWELAYVEQAQAVTRETLELFRNLEEVADTRYRSGKTSFQDVVRIRIRIAVLEEELKTLKETERNFDAKIVELLDLSTDTRLGRTAETRPDQTVPPLDLLYRSAEDNRQEIRRIRAEIGRMERMVEMAETMVLPPYTFGFSYYEDDAFSTAGPGAMKSPFPDSTPAGRGKGLPKSPWYGTEDPWLRQTRLKTGAMKQDLEKTKAATRNAVRNAWFMLDKAVREYALYRERIVDLSKSALEVSTSGYESGTVSFADVAESHATWLSANLSAARKRSDVGIAWAKLEKVVGAAIDGSNGDRSDEK